MLAAPKREIAPAPKPVRRTRPALAPKQKSAGVLLLLPVIIFFFAANSLLVYRQSQVQKERYVIRALVRERQQALEENAALKVQVAQLSSPQRIEKEARTRLGMVSPTEVQTVDPTAPQPKITGLASRLVNIPLPSTETATTQDYGNSSFERVFKALSAWIGGKNGDQTAHE